MQVPVWIAVQPCRMPKGVIQRAVQLYRKRRFPQVIRLLESQVFRFRENAEFYRLIGSACLQTGDIGGAESYLRRADQLRPDDPSVLIGLAAAHLKRGDSDKALSVWLRVIEVDPGNRTAMRGLNLLRQASAAERYPELGDPRAFRRLLPPIPLDPRRVVIPVVIAAVLALLVIGYFHALPLVPRLASRRAHRPGVAEIALTDTRLTLSPDPDGGEFQLTQAEVERLFEQTKNYLLAYRDNLAIREANRILRSNASVYVKEKARLLKTFVVTPDFTTIRDPFSFQEVAADPLLYRDCFVVWRGKIANLRIGDEAIVFDLLVGYEDSRELLGIVPVMLDFAVTLENGYAVEVLGQVGGADTQIALKAISLHRLYRVP